MKRILCFLTLIVLCVALLSACGCEHLDRNGDGRCDKCVKKMPEPTTTNTPTVTTTDVPPEFPESAAVAAAIDAVIGNAYLGAAFDIGLTPQTAPYYRIEGEEGFVTINAEGMLEFVGIRALTTFFSVKGPNDETVYSGSYHIGSRPLAAAIRAELQKEGKLTGLDAPAALLPEMASLSLDGIAVEYTELSALRYCKGLQSLSLAGQSLGDLSYIHALPALRSLDISCAKGLSLDDGGLAVVSHIRSLSKLESVSIVGSYSSLNRAVFDVLLSMAANGNIALTALPDLTSNGPSAIGFGETVFFSLEEYIDHYRRHDGIVTPASGYSHAVFSYSAAEQGKDSPIDANRLTRLELYGVAGAYYCTPVSTAGNLSVHLYSFSLRAPRAENSFGISVGGKLTLTAVGGASSIYGGGWDSSEGSLLWPGEGVRAESLDLYTQNGATLYIEGGVGCAGSAGTTDNYSPDETYCQKNGTIGGEGASAVYVTESVTFYAKSGIVMRGGRGGRGGNGAKGGSDWLYVATGGFNGGHGGTGGDGGVAIKCMTLAFDDAITSEERDAIWERLYGGAGGNGGSGGAGYAAGKTGNAGSGGSYGSRIAYH